MTWGHAVFTRRQNGDGFIILTCHDEVGRGNSRENNYLQETCNSVHKELKRRRINALTDISLNLLYGCSSDSQGRVFLYRNHLLLPPLLFFLQREIQFFYVKDCLARVYIFWNEKCTSNFLQARRILDDKENRGRLRYSLAQTKTKWWNCCYFLCKRYPAVLRISLIASNLCLSLAIKSDSKRRIKKLSSFSS